MLRLFSAGKAFLLAGGSLSQRVAQVLPIAAPDTDHRESPAPATSLQLQRLHAALAQQINRFAAFRFYIFRWDVYRAGIGAIGILFRCAGCQSRLDVPWFPAGQRLFRIPLPSTSLSNFTGIIVKLPVPVNPNFLRLRDVFLLQKRGHSGIMGNLYGQHRSNQRGDVFEFRKKANCYHSCLSVWHEYVFSSVSANPENQAAPLPGFSCGSI